MRQRRLDLVPFVALLVALAFLATACAGNLRDNLRRGALVAGESALSIDQDEAALYAAGAYSSATHKEAGKAIIVMLTAVRTYERAARAWPEHVVMPTDVPQALADALKAITVVEGIMAGIPGNGKILANLDKLHATIGGK